MAKGGGKGGGKGAKGAKGPKGGGHHGGRGGGGNSLAGLAHQQVLQAEIPIEQQIAAEKQANLAKAKAQMGFSQAAAALMQHAAPAVGDAYTGAANSDAGYARALGSAVQTPINQNQQQSNAFLTQMGTPQGAQHQAAPVGDIAYGLQGYIPATTLQREGAAWESAAQLAPGNELTAGQQAAGATLNGPDSTLASLHSDLAKIAATEPDVYNKLLTISNEQAYRAATLKQGQERIGLTAQRDAVLASQGQQRINLEGARLQVSIRQAAQRNAQAWARIGIEGKRLKMEVAKNQAKLNGGGFTPDELVHIKGQAANMAFEMHSGGMNKDGTPDPTRPPRSLKYALNYLIAHGIPASIALSELKSAGYNVPKPPTFLQKLGVTGVMTGKILETPAAQKLVSLAHEYLGTPYVWGGRSPKGFDCSGFAQYLYSKVGISIPPTTYTQWQAGRPVSRGNLRPGDLVFFNGSDARGGLPGHVGIYIGDGMMIDAPHTGSSVRIESVWSFGGYRGARRYGNG